jgi:hypothetical protein
MTQLGLRRLASSTRQRGLVRTIEETRWQVHRTLAALGRRILGGMVEGDGWAFTQWPRPRGIEQRMGMGLPHHRFSREWAEASRKARELLIAHLPPEQLKDFERSGCFTVVGNKTGTTYRLGSGVVRTHDASFCIGPVDAGLPRDDRVLTQKWLLETDEEKFLKIANRLNGLRW